jgi:phytoene dehydrogenase-like protein
MDQAAFDVVVVGGGLGGLATAALVARRGKRAIVLERGGQTGGRAATLVKSGFAFNQGAHAWYAGGASARVFEALGVRPVGKKPPVSGVAVAGGKAHALPSTLGGLLATSAVPWSAKLGGASLFARLGSFDAEVLAGVSWSDFAEAHVSDPAMRAALEAFVRVSTYANAPRALSAGAAIAQLRLAQRPGVRYLDDGWGTLVAAVERVAREAGVEVRTDARVATALREGARWRVALEGGEAVTGDALVLATGPASARSIVASSALAAWAERCVPARTACLDVALSKLPNPRATFALGVDQPTYLSVHSLTARLAPAGAALVSTMKYLPAGTKGDAARDEADLEALLDLLQPGWRDVVVERRWLPAMVATNAIPLARDGGLAARPPVRVPDAPDVLVVGDWVGGEGMLLDASLASAERVAHEIAEAPRIAHVA